LWLSLSWKGQQPADFALMHAETAQKAAQEAAQEAAQAVGSLHTVFFDMKRLKRSADV
jgi:hypothetical protein